MTQAVTHALESVVLGLGSAHGDDQFGWLVVDRLNAAHSALSARKLAHPIDALPWLETASSVHLVDAVVGDDLNAGESQGSQDLICLRYSKPSHRRRLQRVQSHGTHDSDLLQTLALADSLGKRTRDITLWLGQAIECQPMTPATQRMKVIVDGCSDRILSRLLAFDDHR